MRGTLSRPLQTLPTTAVSLPSAVASPSSRRWWWEGGALLAAWLILWDKLRIDWSVNEQYAYGWFVPPLAMALLALRWRDRPAPSPGTAAAGTPRSLMVVACVCLALLLPVRLLEEPNGDWRTLFWLHAALLVLLSLTLAAWRGGRAWAWHFAFPVFFLLLALCWPLRLEQALVQRLMRAVAGVAAEIMGALGIPAVQQGNLIRVRSQMVGVNEACSGIRSLQTVVMAALFLGELSRLSWQRRLALLAGGIAVAMAANVFRSSLLVWIAANYGSERLEHYHDTAGLSVLVIVFAGLLAINGWLERPARRLAARLAAEEKARETASGESPDRPAPPAPASTTGLALRRAPVGFAVATLLWLTCCELGTAAWYQAHERRATPAPGWTVAMPRSAPGYRELPIDNVTRMLLRYDAANTAQWRCPAEPRAADCTLYFFHWEPGRMSATLAGGHTPSICLPSHGWTLVAERGVRPCATASGVNLSVHEYEYLAGDRPIYVYYVSRQEQSVPTPTGKDVAYLDRQETVNSGWSDGNVSYLDRARAVLRGERNLGQQTLECIISGPKSADEAWAVFARQMNDVIQRKG